MLHKILIAALLAGTIAGLLYTGIQRVQLIPLIEEAELLEHRSDTTHTEENPILDSVPHQHDHKHPESTSKRTLKTLLSNILAGIGFALVVVSAITFTGHKGWYKGLLWGIAGYFVFFVAPSIGLQPKVPGTAAADLQLQQLWWLATVLASASGLAFMIFAQKAVYKGIGLVFLISPHIVGAPIPEQSTPNAVEQLSQHFVAAAAIANGLFWIILGCVSGILVERANK